MDERAELIEILRDKSLLKGRFVLASGKESDYYLDCKRTTLSSPRGLYLASRLLFQQIKEIQHKKHIDAIGGLTIGAAPLSIGISQLALHHNWELPAFSVRDDQKAHGTKRLIEGGVEPGWNVVIVDDVMTTGNSVMKAIKAVEGQGARVAHVLILIDREEGGMDLLHEYDVDVLFSYKRLVAG